MPSGAIQVLSHMLGGAPLWLWLLFHVIVFVLLGVDVYLTRTAVPSRIAERRSYWLTGTWILAAMLFAVLVHRALSRQYALEYLTGYGIEESLSIDNLFVFLVLFRAFGIAAARQRRVLFFGVLGAIVMRAMMIFAGVRLLNAFWWMNYFFGAILLYTAWHLFRESQKPEAEQPPRLVRLLTRHLPLAANNYGGRFLVRENGRVRFTALFVALVAIETTDLIFATDSVPAVLAISHHPFVVYSSNIFAVLGLRSLYFTLAAVLERLHKLRYGLAAILLFVGAKMMLAHIITIPIWISLAVLGSAVAITAVWSLLTEPSPAKLMPR
ncbi:MAG: TerC/Alx family metal homeostasis membrane protein [Acidobacteriaceae bacterium]